MQINRPSILTLALILAVTKSTASHPIRTSKWVKTEQFQDPNARGIWKVFEKDPYDLLPDPPHVKYNGNPAWPTREDNNPTEQHTPNNRYTTGTSEAGKPTVSILIPTSAEIPEQMHKHYSHHTEENEHYFSVDKQSSINAPAAPEAGSLQRDSTIPTHKEYPTQCAQACHTCIFLLLLIGLFDLFLYIPVLLPDFKI
ncbi:hypothetical protein N7491_004576 [Penicillium cf. griseofulvum]|nr:hypothetical protein N7491_004576 [Penicillium cf. griseofulvum]